MKLNKLKFSQIKNMKYFSLLLVLFSVFFFSSCDKFNSLPLNIPYRIPFYVSGSDNTSYTGSYCPDEQSETYQSYLDKIKSLSYVQASLNVDSLSSSSLTVNIQVEIKDASGNTLVSYPINNFKPSDYTNKAYVITLTQNEIIALNNYLNQDFSNNCIQVSMQISGLSNTDYVGGYLDLVLEADTQL